MLNLDQHADEGDLTELPEIPLVGPEWVYSHAELGVPVPEIRATRQRQGGKVAGRGDVGIASGLE